MCITSYRAKSLKKSWRHGGQNEFNRIPTTSKLRKHLSVITLTGNICKYFMYGLPGVQRFCLFFVCCVNKRGEVFK